MPLFQFLFPPNSMTWVSIRRWFLLWVFVAIGATSVQAQTVTQQTYKGTPHDEVQKSMKRRDWNNALWITEEYLQEQPRDPQMRFWRARLLEQLNRTDEALDTYLDLSREYPELPEVQNNLGVMLAARAASMKPGKRLNMRYATTPITPPPTKTWVTYSFIWRNVPTTAPFVYAALTNR